MHKRCSGIRGKLKEDIKYKSQTCASQQTDKTADCPGIELNAQFLEIVEKFCLCDTIITREGAFNSAITRIWSEWCEFRYLVTLLASRGLPL